jgi:hypothetical protein
VDEQKYFSRILNQIEKLTTKEKMSDDYNEKKEAKEKKCFRVRFLGYMYNRESGIHITKYKNFPAYIPNLTYVKDNLKMYNE